MSATAPGTISGTIAGTISGTISGSAPLAFEARPDPGRRSPRSLLARALVGVAVALGLAVVAACGGGDACDPGKCSPGNQCLVFDGVVACRKTCTSNDDVATNCPYGYTCTDPQDGGPAFCVASRAAANGRPLTEAPGQWGAPCDATKGIENPQCDGAQGFRCYGQAPTDGEAYCTRYECAADADCGAGFWCATVNETPNVESARRTAIAATVNVCERRGFCDPCEVDLDCLPLKGVRQHCITDESGQGMCTPECQNAGNCEGIAKESLCGDAGIGVKICYPRAKVCVGDGSLCAPCRSDLDCGDDGICVRGEFTGERTCAKKAGGSCDDNFGDCPEQIGSPPVAVACAGGNVFDEVVPGYCHGLLSFGGGQAVGCWTRLE